MTSATDLIRDALVIALVLDPEETLTPGQGQQGLRCLNQILDQWSLMPLTIPVTARETFALTAGRGGPSDPYTIGPGGDFDTSRPTSITSVGLLDSSQTQPFELSRSLYTGDAYTSITVKELTSTYFAGLYYEPTFADGLGTIYLYPVPSVSTTELVLYRPMQLRSFTSLTDQYDFPPGAVSALSFELAKWLAQRFGRGWDALLDRMRTDALAVYQRANTQMTDLSLDAALTQTGGVYNILSDALSGFRGR